MFKLNVQGPERARSSHVCKSTRKDADGVICTKATIGKAKHKQGSRYEYKAKFFDFPGFWLNSPGTYYWQAYRTHATRALATARPRGRS